MSKENADRLDESKEMTDEQLESAAAAGGYINGTYIGDRDGADGGDAAGMSWYHPHKNGW